MSLSALKNSHLEQLDSEFFALLSTRLYILKIDHLIMRNGITNYRNFKSTQSKKAAQCSLFYFTARL
ncbi:hypothetical protein CWC16_12680 [Pseudoalteromonas sp. S3776]|nr:hypothetical protein CWC17_16480 [Pseudoalteromonas sp. S3785]TMO79395.1 hypothetical protein CWC16_12680 [Pseudoalteromonas sp. S3776]